MVGGSSPAALVLASSVFLKVKYLIYKRKVINKRTSVIFGLVRLMVLSYIQNVYTRVDNRLPLTMHS